jgi:hypothetical protein
MGWSGEWRWVQEPDFFIDQDSLADYPGAADDLKGEICDWIERDPIGLSEPYPNADGDPRPRRYFFTRDIPRLGIHNPKMILFRVEPEPESGPRFVTGTDLLDDPDV